MIGPQLQGAVVTALKAASIAGGRVYDRVPPNPTFPYVTVGDEVVVDDGDGCAELFDVSIDIHVWSRVPGQVEAKQIGEAVRVALTPALVVSDYAVILHEFETSRVIRDPDGLTAHAVITFRWLLQPED